MTKRELRHGYLIVGLVAIGAALTWGHFGLFRPDLSLTGAADLLGVVGTILIAWLILWVEGAQRGLPWPRPCCKARTDQALHQLPLQRGRGPIHVGLVAGTDTRGSGGLAYLLVVEIAASQLAGAPPKPNLVAVDVSVYRLANPVRMGCPRQRHSFQSRRRGRPRRRCLPL